MNFSNAQISIATDQVQRLADNIHGVTRLCKSSKLMSVSIARSRTGTSGRASEGGGIRTPASL
jgi:hypothetical protein